jgi:ABC-type amino acid transport substrate-binding protein
MFLFLIANKSYAYKAMLCGVSIGYPPYQFQENKKIVGLDKELVDLFNLYSSDYKVRLSAMPWSDAIAKLHYTDELDCVWGMEITEERKKKFKFTSPIYYRYSSLIVLKKSSYHKIDDLKSKVIGSDLDSSIHNTLSQDSNYRLKKVRSKIDSFESLMNGEFAAAIMPLKVANYFAEKNNQQIRVLHKESNGTPVGIASKSAVRIEFFEKRLKRIPKEKIKKILSKYSK